MMKRLSTVINPTDPGLNQPGAMSEDKRPSPSDSGVRFSIAQESRGSMRLSLAGRLAKRLSRANIQRRNTLATCDDSVKEPTYRMEPKTKFSGLLVENAIKDVLEDKLENFQYDPKLSSTLAKILTNEIKDRVKEFSFDRYKIVCVVNLAQKCQQGIMSTSRCNWDTKNDNFASYTYENPHVVCSASVYGVYRE